MHGMRNSLTVLVLLALGALLPLGGRSAPLPLPDREWQMLREVASEYALSTDETWLLAAIRIHENGRPGLEFGVGGPMNSGHKAHRYRDGIRSFRIQCAWAAGTIKKRYTGNIFAFGRRYNPINAVTWSKSVASIILRLKNQYNGVLP